MYIFLLRRYQNKIDSQKFNSKAKYRRNDVYDNFNSTWTSTDLIIEVTIS